MTTPHPLRAYTTRGYQDALVALNELQSNAEAILKWRETRRQDPEATLSAEMQAYCHAASVDLHALGTRAVHGPLPHLPTLTPLVAGTKGKGSTCALVEAQLRAGGLRTGLYTSPHLISVRERIKLQGQPLTQAQFAHYFWLVYDAIVTVMSFRVFQDEAVDVAVVEVGIGGRTDSTNVLPTALACGLTTLDLDHTEVLGPTLLHIAYEKAGIMKPHVPAIHAPTPPGPQQVFVERAGVLGGQLWAARPWSDYALPPSALSLPGAYQHINAALALALVQVVLASRSGQPFPPPLTAGAPFPLLPPTPSMLLGLREVSWPGRAQTVRGVGGKALDLLLDGGHTEASLLASAEWWLGECRGREGGRVLVFNCKQSKPAATLLAALADAHAQLPYERVLFVAAKVRRPRDPSNALTNQLDEDTRPQEHLKALWETEASKRGLRVPPSEVFPAIEDALDSLLADAGQRPPSAPLRVHVTGSLYLVGGFLDAIGFTI